IICSLLVLNSCNSAEKPNKNKSEVKEAPLNKLSAQQKADGWQLLFDGKTSEGWRGFKQSEFPNKGWHIADGAMMIEYSGMGEEGFAGDIITEKTYKNFELQLDWKISPGGNSGILFYVTETDKYDVTWHTAQEIQVLVEFGYDDLNDSVVSLRQISGALYDLYSPFSAPSKPVGEWNHERLRIENGHLQNWLNNTLVVDVQHWTDEWRERVDKSKFNEYPDFGLAKEGHIALQDHGQQVWFRSIKILEL
ncbi:MAG: DUF1080 domain-containing protein, partial [Bacteroidales bacterium]|nr:DUF1080 domain-containing protein [Bacteroidales bacterium]